MVTTMNSDKPESKPREFRLRCEISDGWWNVVGYPDGFNPRGETMEVVERSALARAEAEIEGLRGIVYGHDIGQCDAAWQHKHSENKKLQAEIARLSAEVEGAKQAGYDDGYTSGMELWHREQAKSVSLAKELEAARVALDKLTMRMNPATAAWRHRQFIDPSHMDKLCNAQIEAEQALAELRGELEGKSK